MLLFQANPTSPFLSPAERQLAVRLVDHWNEAAPTLTADPRLWQACCRLLDHYRLDMIWRIEAISLEISPAGTCDAVADPCRREPRPQRTLLLPDRPQSHVFAA